MSKHSIRTTPRPSPSKKPPAPRFESLPPAYFFAPDLEREINRLEGVTSVKVMSTGTEIDEIHVIAPRERPPKKVVRDIESLLLVRFGIRIDHRCISVVQIDRLQMSYSQLQRPQIQEVTNVEGSVRLALAIGGDIIIGQAKSTGEGEELEAVGRAVINAIEQLLQTPGVVTVLKTRVAEMNAYRIALVLVRWVFGEQQELLIGASLIHDDPFEAIARATLDAVNRRLVKFQSSRE